MAPKMCCAQQNLLQPIYSMCSATGATWITKASSIHHWSLITKNTKKQAKKIDRRALTLRPPSFSSRMVRNQPTDIEARWFQSTCSQADDVLLEIFDLFARKEPESTKEEVEGWQLLVHVCRRWRSVVFGSPRRLDLGLLCSNKTPARDMLDVWPAFPLFIECDETAKSVDGIVAVLERRDRVRYIDLTNFKSSDLEIVLAAMQAPFPELTNVALMSNGETVSVLPDSFLGGSAPRLEHLSLDGIPFPGLPNLLLSATHLVTLRLLDIPNPGYFSPEAIVTALSTLTRLESFWLIFESPQSRPDQARQPPPPPTRSVLPALTYFWFKGVSKYFEDIVAHIDAPRLKKLNIIFFDIVFDDTPQFTRFFSRTPMSELLEKANVTFGGSAAMVNVLSETSGEDENSG
ncbi:hypothetical protein DFH94DRAFT_684656 [Russula ochroleuca]|uniref:F-box domain-containing protein n=1 Tax=Russula ochroleuca TaxID=152965 RepID=A0A9P5JYP7_9AGAM|nr:hypothetical protein DFH94DRAFT_684656 [Russula ochroleuca]